MSITWNALEVCIYCSTWKVHALVQQLTPYIYVGAGVESITQPSYRIVLTTGTVLWNTSDITYTYLVPFLACHALPSRLLTGIDIERWVI